MARTTLLFSYSRNEVIDAIGHQIRRLEAQHRSEGQRYASDQLQDLRVWDRVLARLENSLAAPETLHLTIDDIKYFGL